MGRGLGPFFPLARLAGDRGPVPHFLKGFAVGGVPRRDTNKKGVAAAVTTAPNKRLQMDDTRKREEVQADALLAIALAYHRREWSIIPIAVGTKKPPPRSKWKPYQSRRPTEAQLRRWFLNRTDRGLAVIHGAVSGGLVCRDFDVMESYDRWAREHPDLATTLPTVATARGRRVYFLAAEHYAKLDDGELIGDSKHYSVLPPSPHPDGPLYHWLIPLPDGPLVFIDDLHGAGFLPADVTQKAQKAQKAQVVPGSPRKSQVVGGCGGGAKKVAPHLDLAVQEAIDRTIPTRPRTRRDKLFELARRLKAIPEFENLPTTEVDLFEPYLRKWWKEAKPNTSGTHPRFEQSWQDFIFAWEEARIPFGATMQELFEKARETAPPTKAVEKYGAGSLRTLLASLCRELQHFHGDDRFHLSGRAAAPLLGVSDVQAWRWLNTLERDGIIRLLKKYPRGTRLAREYRYVAE